MNKDIDPDTDLLNALQDWVDFNREAARALQNGEPWHMNIRILAWTKCAKALRRFRGVKASDDMRRVVAKAIERGTLRRSNMLDVDEEQSECEHSRIGSHATGRWCYHCGEDM